MTRPLPHHVDLYFERQLSLANQQAKPGIDWKGAVSFGVRVLVSCAVTVTVGIVIVTIALHLGMFDQVVR